MKPRETLAAFKKRIAIGGKSALAAVSPWQGALAMFDFYREVLVDRCDGPDADMLLFQWGTYDWGGGPAFELNITRQLLVPSGDDEKIFQLALTFFFPETPERTGFGVGSHWCHGRTELDRFRGLVRAAAPMMSLGTTRADRVTVRYEAV